MLLNLNYCLLVLITELRTQKDQKIFSNHDRKKTFDRK